MPQRLTTIRIVGSSYAKEEYMKTPSKYRLQAREALKNLWAKSALATLVFLFAILTPSIIVIWCTDGFDAPNTSPLWAWLAIFSGFGVVPFTYAYCAAFLNHIRTKKATFLKDTWYLGTKNYGRFLGAFMLVYLISLAIGGVMNIASTILEKHDSLLAILIVVAVMLWLFVLMLQVMYAYRMVPYLIHDDPQLKVISALKQSNEMMKGYKLLLFKIDLSLVQWYIYAMILTLIFVFVGEAISSYCLLIIGGIMCFATLIGTFLFLYPYINTTSALFYEDLKADKISDNILTQDNN